MLGNKNFKFFLFYNCKLNKCRRGNLLCCGGKCMYCIEMVE